MRVFKLFRWFRPNWRRPLTQVWAASLWMSLLANWPLWRHLLELPEVNGVRGLWFTLAAVGMVTASTGAILSLLAWPKLVKGVLVLCLLTAATLSHFIGSYGIVFDPTMVVNTMQTDLRETRDLLSWHLLLALVALGAVPAWLLLRQSPPPAQRWWLRLGGNLGAFGLGMGITVALALAVFADLSSTMRNHKFIRYMITPLNAVYSVASATVRNHTVLNGPPAVIGADAHLLTRASDTKPPLLLLVVGETARAMNFSLNGYERPTNTQLSDLPVVSLRNVTSCGTSTAASLPCMFSPLGREAFMGQQGPQENLLDVLQRAGLAVLWIDNQSGCKGVCDRVPSMFTDKLPKGASPHAPGMCNSDQLANVECFDDALLHEIDKRIATLDPERVRRGLIVVMHQMGSHGPAYYKRSPSSLKHFLPECSSNALQQCERQHVVNAYDNTIATTDQLLAQSIRWLQAQAPRYDVGMLYVSDHGESLGERGLFLHGMPYAMAPAEQTRIPMILWVPTQGALATSLKPGCLQGWRDKPASHDNLFHTVMGWVGARADVYQSNRDILAACRR